MSRRLPGLLLLSAALHGGALAAPLAPRGGEPSPALLIELTSPPPASSPPAAQAVQRVRSVPQIPAESPSPLDLLPVVDWPGSDGARARVLAPPDLPGEPRSAPAPPASAAGTERTREGIPERGFTRSVDVSGARPTLPVFEVASIPRIAGWEDQGADRMPGKAVGRIPPVESQGGARTLLPQPFRAVPGPAAASSAGSGLPPPAGAHGRPGGLGSPSVALDSAGPGEAGHGQGGESQVESDGARRGSGEPPAPPPGREREHGTGVGSRQREGGDDVGAQEKAAALLARLGTTGSGEAGRQPPAEYAPYLQRLRGRIQEAITYPAAARRRGLAGTVRVEIVLGPAGEVQSVTLVGSSEHSVLDRAVVEAVRGLPPLPFPPELPRRPLRVELPIVFDFR